MKEVKVQKDGIVKIISEAHLSIYLEQGWKKVEENANYFSSPFTKIQ